VPGLAVSRHELPPNSAAVQNVLSRSAVSPRRGHGRSECGRAASRSQGRHGQEDSTSRDSRSHLDTKSGGVLVLGSGDIPRVASMALDHFHTQGEPAASGDARMVRNEGDRNSVCLRDDCLLTNSGLQANLSSTDHRRGAITFRRRSSAPYTHNATRDRRQQ